MAGASPLAVWDEHHVKVEQIAVQAITDLEKAIVANPAMSRTELAWLLRRVNAQWGTLAAQDAADTMVITRAAAGLYDLQAPAVVSPITEETADALAGWAQAGQTPEQVLRRAAISSTRHVRNASRDTVSLSAESAGTGWCRVPRPGSCAFCLMLASRGAVYSSRATALTVGAAPRKRGPRAAGSRYHDNCGCMVQEVLPGHGAPPIVQGLEHALVEMQDANGHKPVTLAQWHEYVRSRRTSDAAARRAQSRTMSSARARGRALERLAGESELDYWARRAASTGIDFGSEQIKAHEVRMVERLLDAGQDVVWLPRKPSAPSNDMLLTIAGERVPVEAKTCKPRYQSIHSRIVKAASSAANHAEPVVKDAFLIDIGNAQLSESLLRELEGFNVGRRKYRLRHLLVLSEDGARLTAVSLRQA